MRPIPHRAHRKFVETEGWEKKGKARSPGKTGDHFRYTLTLMTGDVLYTRVSHGAGQLDDPKLIAAVLREELQVTEKQFWACVNQGVVPSRPMPREVETRGDALDAKLTRNLVRRVGLSLEQIEKLTKEEAVERWQRYLAGGEM